MRFAWRAIAVTAVLTVGWTVGLLWLAWALMRVLRFAIRFVAALRPRLRCPECRATTAVYARWRCRDHVYDGFAFRCPICAEWAGHIACERCGMTVVSPLHQE